ncbi:hypothetical protein CP980_10505 [Streptomyces vinaceus]|uniref:Uncharacterized protein n=1 Tax=Streptomyces vinaceus TaxID=1960 RepID=A0A5J6JFP5_STRVI|nr:hypothetical protein CP980_10505 [Streptomyces vinaceus]
MAGHALTVARRAAGERALPPILRAAAADGTPDGPPRHRRPARVRPCRARRAGGSRPAPARRAAPPGPPAAAGR